VSWRDRVDSTNTNSISKRRKDTRPYPREPTNPKDNDVSFGGRSKGGLFPESVSRTPWITTPKTTQGINPWGSKDVTTTTEPSVTQGSVWIKGKRRRKKKPRVLNPSSTSKPPREPSEEEKKLITQINSLRSQLQTRYKMLQEVMNEVEDFSIKLRRMIKELRWRRLYFYDTLLLKTMKYNGNSIKQLTNEMKRIDSVRNALDKSSNKSSWKTRYAIKEVSDSNVLKDADQVAKSTRVKLQELTEIVDDMARENDLQSTKG
jgi:hypothetical protein